MSSLLDRASKKAGKIAIQAATVRLKITRGDHSVTIENAGLGEEDAVVDVIDRVYSRAEQRDFIVDAADLVLNGSATKPAERDTLEVLDADDVVLEKFRCLSPSESEEAWSYFDRFRNHYRIHAKEIN